VVQWKRLLEGTGASLAPGIEIRYQPVPNGPAFMMGPELTAGAALPLLHGGADLAYLFNFDPLPLLRMTAPGGGPLWTMESFGRMGRALQTAESLGAQARLHAVTYHDVRAPGEPADNALPAVDSGEDFPWPPGCAVRVVTGPKPSGRAVELRLEFAATTVAPEKLRIFVNSTECQAVAGVSGLNRRYTVPGPALQEEAQVVEILTPPGVPPFKLLRVELFVAEAIR
jgi:hypothetical protein